MPSNAFDRRTTGVLGGLEHDWRHRANQNRLGHPARLGARHVVRHLTAAGGMADVHRTLEVECIRQRGDIGRVGIHLVAVKGLGRASVSAPIMRDHAVAMTQEEQHLRVQSSELSGQPW